MNRIKHIFWDWNGTLLDDCEFCSGIINEILEENDLPKNTIGQYRRNFTFPVSLYYKTLGLSHVGVSFETTSASFIEKYQSNWKGCRLHKGALETLSHIKDMSIFQSIITAGKEDFMSEYLEYFGLNGIFAACVGLNHIHASSKKDRAMEYVSSLNIEGENILMVGDTLHDAEVAKAIGARIILFDQGHHETARLATAGVTIVSDLSEIVNYIV